jgi:hypothetical protein
MDSFMRWFSSVTIGVGGIIIGSSNRMTSEALEIRHLRKFSGCFDSVS